MAGVYAMCVLINRIKYHSSYIYNAFIDYKSSSSSGISHIRNEITCFHSCSETVCVSAQIKHLKYSKRIFQVKHSTTPYGFDWRPFFWAWVCLFEEFHHGVIGLPWFSSGNRWKKNISSESWKLPCVLRSFQVPMCWPKQERITSTCVTRLLQPSSQLETMIKLSNCGRTLWRRLLSEFATQHPWKKMVAILGCQ